MSPISVKPSDIARMIGTAAVVIILASTLGQIAKYVFGYATLRGFVPLFDVNNELNIPSFFSVMLLLLASLLLGIITLFSHRQRLAHTLKWAILSFGFLAMAYDEAFSVHESFNAPVRSVLGSANGDNLGIFYYAWVVPALVLVAFLGVFFLRFLLSLPMQTRIHFVVAAGIYLGGGIGFELLNGIYADSYTTQNLGYALLSIVEEVLEMSGIIIFIWALLTYIGKHYAEISIQFGATQPNVVAKG
jgi:hypothetical protein